MAVTGSNGMVGRELCKKLAQKGYVVRQCTKDNADVLSPEKLGQAFRNIDVVIHCAATLDEESKDLYRINVKGTENALEASAKNGVKQFVFLSSVGAYGDYEGLKDENSPLKPQTPYEKSKAEAEQKVLAYQEIMAVTILRPALVLGNNRYWRQIIATVKKNFPMIGEGKNKWQMVCAEDLAEAILICIDNENCYGEIFVVAGKETMTLEEIANTIRAELGMKGQLKKIPVWLGMLIAYANKILNFNPMLKPDYVKRMQRERIYSTKKLEQAGWKAKYPLKQKLGELIKN
ncbi:MAG: NAD-dependent epimerase/dehydratase family protein [archaeon]